MNILDYLKSGEPPPAKDFLVAMMANQDNLEKEYLEIEKRTGLRISENYPLDLDDPRDQLQLKDFFGRLTSEVYEAYECLKNKPHKVTQMPTDKDHFFEEMADVLHFVLAIFCLVGLNAEDIYKLYWAKSEVNKFRQESQY